jgi:hypothetical protein
MAVVDGMHWRERPSCGHATIDVQFFDGEDAEALVAAVKANTEHGLPLPLADRLAAGERIIALLPRQSDRWIAGVTGLAPATVGVIRRRSSAGDARLGRGSGGTAASVPSTSPSGGRRRP